MLDLEYPAGLRLPLHQHEHAYLCVTVAGGFVDRYGSRERSAGPGEVLYYASGAEHAGRFADSRTRILHVELPDDAAGLRPEKRRRRPKRDGTVRGLGIQLARLLSAGQPHPEVVSSLGRELVLAALGEDPPAPGPEWLDTARELIASRLDAPFSLAELAAELDLHPAHVAREFRRRTGMTAGTLHRRLRCAEAARRLAETDEPLAQVAVACGFADQSHMGRVFRELTGTTPGVYRRRGSTAR